MSSREMIEAMINGERDPRVLAAMATSRMRAKIPSLEEAFSGHFGTHQFIAGVRCYGLVPAIMVN
jgi:hypothetical protein